MKKPITPKIITDEFDALKIMQEKDAIIRLTNDGKTVLMKPENSELVLGDPTHPQYEYSVAEVTGTCFRLLAGMDETDIMGLELPGNAPGFYLVAEGFTSEFERTTEQILKLQEPATDEDDQDEDEPASAGMN